MAQRSPLRRALPWVAAVGVLAAVFASYLRPALIVDLASRIWACF